MQSLLFLIVILSTAFNAAADNCTETAELVSVTFYGFPDNSPAGSSIECNLPSQAGCGACNSNGDPNNITTAAACGPRGETAGGTGSYDDPLTMASAGKWFCHLEVVYVPYLLKYLRYEDYCQQCTEDAANGKTTHIDVWTGSVVTNGGKVQIACENTLTPENLQTMIRNPPPDLPVNSKFLKGTLEALLTARSASASALFTPGKNSTCNGTYGGPSAAVALRPSGTSALSLLFMFLFIGSLGMSLM
jgi:hypothetical protein